MQKSGKLSSQPLGVLPSYRYIFELTNDLKNRSDELTPSAVVNFLLYAYYLVRLYLQVVQYLIIKIEPYVVRNMAAHMKHRSDSARIGLPNVEVVLANFESRPIWPIKGGRNSLFHRRRLHGHHS